MIEIPLTQGRVAIVDDCDSWALQYKWHYDRYAVRRLTLLVLTIRQP